MLVGFLIYGGHCHYKKKALGNFVAMLYIQETLISLDIVEEHFICNLDACKGACCVEGDFGAPLTEDEKSTLVNIYADIRPYLLQDSISLIEDIGLYQYYEEGDIYGTTLHKNGACAFLTSENGISKCGIEKAYEDGATTFKKPLSCHLYPIRVTQNEETDFEAWNYDEWDICSAACSLGQKHQVKIFEFLREAIIRAKGELFYEELASAATHLKDNATS